MQLLNVLVHHPAEPQQTKHNQFPLIGRLTNDNKSLLTTWGVRVETNTFYRCPSALALISLTLSNFCASKLNSTWIYLSWDWIGMITSFRWQNKAQGNSASSPALCFLVNQSAHQSWLQASHVLQALLPNLQLHWTWQRGIWKPTHVKIFLITSAITFLTKNAKILAL